jgi:hypothetical protein
MHESRLHGVVIEHLSQLANGCVDAVIGVQEHVLAPDPLHDLIPSYQLSPPLDQQEQQFHGDARKPQSSTGAAQLIGATIQFEIVRKS